MRHTEEVRQSDELRHGDVGRHGDKGSHDEGSHDEGKHGNEDEEYIAEETHGHKERLTDVVKSKCEERQRMQKQEPQEWVVQMSQNNYQYPECWDVQRLCL